MASSKFVSGGTIEEPTERDEEWIAAQREINETRAKQEEIGLQSGGKSLYETLQANKASKQEAFEESIRLKNQFRSLDEDEAEFLESVLESTRAKEDEIRKETSEQLGQFRSQQEEAERLALETEFQAINDDDKGEWLTSGKKRRKIRDKALLQGSKSRKISSPDSSIKIDPQPASAKAKLSTLKPDILTAKDEVAKPKASTYSEGKPTGNKLTTSKPKTDLAHSTSSLGLATYSSSDDDEKDDD